MHMQCPSYVCARVERLGFNCPILAQEYGDVVLSKGNKSRLSLACGMHSVVW